MDSLDSNLVEKIRRMDRRGDRPSVMLHAIVSHLAPASVDRLLLVSYFSDVFLFKDGQAHPIFGWFPDGSGELKDADIDRIMSKRIQQNRTQWDNPDQSSRHAS